MRLKSPLFCIAMSLFWTACLAPKAFAQDSSTTNSEHPKATIIRQPGAEYDNVHRVWQGMPEIERILSGRLWIVWRSGGQGETATNNYLLAASSTNQGKSWSKPVLAIKGPEGSYMSNLILWIDPKGRLWVFYSQLIRRDKLHNLKHHNRPLLGIFGVYADNPDDTDPQWSEPVMISEKCYLIGQPSVRKSDGAWIARPYPSQKENQILQSLDEGKSWQWSNAPADDSNRIITLSEVDQATPETRLNLIVQTLKNLHESQPAHSTEKLTDTKAKTDYSGAASRTSVLKLQSGALMLIYNADDATRQNLTACLSHDEGQTWPHRLILDERLRVTNPEAVQDAEGNIYVVYNRGIYEPGEKEILMCKFHEEDIREGKAVSKDARFKVRVNQAFGYGNTEELHHEAEVERSLPKKEDFHLYLLIGQSNMAGRGELDTSNRIAQDRILKFAPTNRWTYGVEPLHHDKPAMNGSGLGMSFARSVADARPDVTVGIIPCAVGGTPLSRWMPDQQGDLYRDAIKRAEIAMQNGTLKGILWHQGESDSNHEQNAATYAERLAKMVPQLRKDLGVGDDVPFIAGELGQFLKSTKADGKPVYWKEINAQINTLPGLIPNSAVISSEGLNHKGDVLHFNTISLRTFGMRYAVQMMKMQK